MSTNPNYIPIRVPQTMSLLIVAVHSKCEYAVVSFSCCLSSFSNPIPSESIPIPVCQNGMCAFVCR